MLSNATDEMSDKVDQKNHYRYEIKQGFIRKSIGFKEYILHPLINYAFVLNDERVVYFDADRPTALTWPSSIISSNLDFEFTLRCVGLLNSHFPIIKAKEIN